MSARGLRLLLWKNWLLQKRHPVQTFIEIAAPVFFSALLVVVRSLVKPTPLPSVHFEPFSPNLLPDLLPPLLTINNTKWIIGWTPEHPILGEIMQRAGWATGFDEVPFASEDDLVANLTNLEGPLVPMMGGLVFEGDFSNDAELPPDITLKLRFRSVQNIVYYEGNSWLTDQLYPDYQVPGPRLPRNNLGGPPDYSEKGWAAVQHSVSVAILEFRMGRPLQNVTVQLQRFPYPDYIDDPLLEALQGFVSLIFMLSFAYTAINAVRSVTTEKEKQLKESMKIMGLSGWLHWGAWFLNFAVLLTIAVVLMTVLVKVDWYGRNVSVFTNSDGFVIFVFLLLYAITCITFSFLVSTFFSKANTASTVAGVAWFFNYAPYFFMDDSYDVLSTSTKLAASLASNTAMAFGCQFIVQYEGTGEGVQWSNLFRPATPDDGFNLGLVMIMFIVDSIIYMILTLYIEAIFPGDFGVPQPWYFPVMKSYWFPNLGKAVVQPISTERPKDDFYEEEPQGVPAGIKIQQISKEFSGKSAVQDLSLNMFEGQISVLLGHNGAGKTTTMSMLTGLLRPSSGTALVAGYDIRTDIRGVRKSLGLCPQHNILFEELTVKEHLQFYCKLKGLDKDAVRNEVDKYIKLLQFESKANAQAKTLSGGMQRKLSVGVALCGGSKVIMLDEPTSGMDPSARRTLWDVLEVEKKGRTILLTTHFMDEADLLGDRIAIMADGRLQCCGSSFFLKKKYGTGYQLIIAKDRTCQVPEVTRLLQSHLPDVELGADVGSELSYRLPEEEVANFEPALAALETNSARLGVLSYGVSLTTMEEVFVKAGRDRELSEDPGDWMTDRQQDRQQQTNGGVPSAPTIEIDDFGTSTTTVFQGPGLYYGHRLLWNQFCAMLGKRVLSTIRAWLLYLIQVGLPIFFLIIVILVSRVFTQNRDHPALEITLGSYPRVITSSELTPNATRDVPQMYSKYVQLLETGGYTAYEIPDEEDMDAAMIRIGAGDIVQYRGRYLAGATFDFDDERRKAVVTAWFSNQPYHILPLTLNLVHNTLLAHYVGPEHHIKLINFPLPFDAQSQVVRQLSGTLTKGFQYAFNIGFSMAFVSSFYILFYVRERVSKSKHLQTVSGVSGWVFWLASLLWDLVSFIGPAVGIVVTFAAFQEEGFRTATELARIYLVLAAFSWAVLPMIYLAANLFEIPSNGFSRLTILSTFLGVAAFMVVVVLQTPGLNLEDVSRLLEWIFMIFPHYNVTISIFNLYQTYIATKVCTPVLDICPDLPGRNQTNACCREPEECPNGVCLQWTSDYFAWSQTGIARQLVYFGVEGLLLMIIVVLLEYRLFDEVIHEIRTKFTTMFLKKKTVGLDYFNRNEEPMDDDVLKEKNIVVDKPLDELSQDYQLIMRNVTKYYGTFLAVDNLCLGVERGQCFGLLGINGAGKTTTFKMLTGDERISSGDAYLSGLSLTKQMKMVHQLIGYCPQFDALLDDLTGRETLTMFCLLRGVPWRRCNQVVDELAEELIFTKHVDKRVKEYSGGNKRKLSTAVALVGDPPVVYLDEPTTGMDPVAKRHLWDVVCRARERGKSIILTSHSMEECKALCTRLAIMVNGEFKCIGSSQYLKSKFAEGYTLTLKVPRLMSFNKHLEQGSEASDSLLFDTAPAKQFVTSTFPGAQLKEEVQGMLTYYLPHVANLSWSRMFGLMEQAKQRLGFEDYSLGQTTLEQVFLSFTKSQRQVDY